MKFLVALSCVLVAVSAKPSVVAPFGYNYATPYLAGSYATPYGYSAPAYTAYAAPAYSTYAAAPYAAAAVAAPVATSSVTTTQVATAPVAAVAAAPVAVAAAPVAVAAPVAAVATPLVEKTQYHAQDALGQASYGHSEAFQAHNAVQDAAGNKVGSYSYVAPTGEVFSTNYVADALGYRVATNALPTGPSAVPVAPAETPEVYAARVAHLNAHAAAKSRSRRAIAAISPLAYSTPLVHNGYTAYSAYSAPVYSHSTLSTVVNTPAHAVSYHVY